jgi:molecular chaperone GrpE
MDGARNFAIQRFAKDLLDSIDNFDRALLAVPADKLSAAKTDENKDFLELVSGLKMTQNILLNTLQKHGLERFDPAEKVDGKAQKFDPNLHEATFMAKADGLEDGDVMFVQSKGFTLNGRVLRVSTTLIPALKITLTDFVPSIGCQGWCRQEHLTPPDQTL